MTTSFSEVVGTVTVPTTNASGTFSIQNVRETFSNASNVFVSSPEGQILRLKAEVVSRQEAQRLVPIVQSNLLSVAQLGGFSTTVYPRVTSVTDPMFAAEVDIVHGVYVRSPTVQIFNAPCIVQELRNLLGNEFFIQNLSSNAIYVGTEPYPYRR